MASTIWLLLFGVVAVGGAGLAAPHVAGSSPGSSGRRAPGLGAATGAVLATLPEPVRRRAAHVHLCFSGSPDEAFVGQVWAVNQAPVSVWAAGAWVEEVGRASYRDGATHVLVGPASWLLHSLALVRQMVANRTVNIKKTQWVFVSTEPEDKEFRTRLESHISERLNVLLLQTYTPHTATRPSRRRRSFMREETEEDIDEDSGEVRKREEYEEGKYVKGYKDYKTSEAVHQAGRPGNPPCTKYQDKGSPAPKERKMEEQSNENWRKQLVVEGEVVEENNQDREDKSSRQRIKRIEDQQGGINKREDHVKQSIANTRGRWVNTAQEEVQGETLQSSGTSSRTRRQTTSTYRSTSRTRQLEENVDVTSSSVEAQVSVHEAGFPGDGSVTLQRVGVWSRSSGLVFIQQLQAGPSASFHSRDLVLTTVHKPGVFEVRGKDDKVKGSLREVDGYVAELMRVLEHHLNFTSVLTTTNIFGSQLLNGSWNGMLGFLTRGEADMSPLDFSPSWARAQAVDFSEWFSTDGVVIISKAPKSVQLPFLLLQIFSGWVWLAILVVGVMTGNLLWALDYLLRHARSNRPLREHGMYQQQQPGLTYSDAVTTTLKLFLTQSSKTWCVSWSGRVLCSCLFLVVVSVVALYQGYIIAFLAVPRRAVPIDSATHLMDRLAHITPIVRKNTVYYRFVVNFESYSPIAANLKFHQDSFLNTWDFFQLIDQGKYALIDTYSSGVGRAARFESRTECRFHVSRQVLKADLDLMAHPQNSIFREHIDRALRRLRSFGIIEKIKAQYYSTSCGKELTQRDPLALSLTQVQSAFYLLAVGFIISLMGFILEIINNLCSN